jgi:phage shock protein C
MKKLTKSSVNKTICGVCGGIAAYGNCDPVLIRAIWLVGTIVTGFFPGIIAYFALVVLLPYDSEVN